MVVWMGHLVTAMLHEGWHMQALVLMSVSDVNYVRRQTDWLHDHGRVSTENAASWSPTSSFELSNNLKWVFVIMIIVVIIMQHLMHKHRGRQAMKLDERWG